MLNDAYKKMRQVGLLRGPDSKGNMLVLPAAARYSAVYDIAAQETKSKAKESSSSLLKATTSAPPGIYWEKHCAKQRFRHARNTWKKPIAMPSIPSCACSIANNHCCSNMGRTWMSRARRFS
ncbi:MAG: hypothetical protein NVS3B14_02640 [Ktedonobacteraceae bacterium]